MEKQMTRKSGLQSDADKKALAWFLEINAGKPVAPRRWKKFLEWLKEDPSHEQLLSQYELMWSGLAALENSPEIVGYATSEDEPVVRSRWPFFAAAAAVALLIISLTAWNFVYSRMYATLVGEQRTIVLSDGSQVILNTDSELKVHFMPWRRDVELVRGEAFFSVAHRRWQPFLVHVGAGSVRAIGTKFVVRNGPDRVLVALVQGRVLVSTAPRVTDQTVEQKQILAPGEITQFDETGVQSSPKAAELAMLTAWTRGRLSFDDQPLAEVLKEVNRYTTEKVSADEPELARRKISAYFEIDHTADFISELPHMLDVDAVMTANGISLRSKKKAREPK
jgi:transmembrane sensor